MVVVLLHDVHVEVDVHFVQVTYHSSSVTCVYIISCIYFFLRFRKIARRESWRDSMICSRALEAAPRLVLGPKIVVDHLLP